MYCFNRFLVWSPYYTYCMHTYFLVCVIITNDIIWISFVHQCQCYFQHEETLNDNYVKKKKLSLCVECYLWNTFEYVYIIWNYFVLCCFDFFICITGILQGPLDLRVRCQITSFTPVSSCGKPITQSQKFLWPNPTLLSDNNHSKFMINVKCIDGYGNWPVSLGSFYFSKLLTTARNIGTPTSTLSFPILGILLFFVVIFFGGGVVCFFAWMYFFYVPSYFYTSYIYIYERSTHRFTWTVANTGRHNQTVHTSADATADERKTEKLLPPSKRWHTLYSSEVHLHAAIWFRCSHCNTILADHALRTF